MERDLANAVQLRRVSELTFHAEIPSGWYGGVGVFGGLIVCTLARAAVAIGQDTERSLRVFSCDFCRPVKPGEATIELRVFRHGKRFTNIDLIMQQNGEVAAHGGAVLGVPCNSDVQPRRPTAPPQPSWEDATLIPLRPPLGPEFGERFEYRSTGPRLFSQGPIPETMGWIRQSTPAQSIDAPTLIGLLDAWWPALYTVDTRPRPGATVSFRAEITGDPSTAPPEAPIFCHGKVLSVYEGFVSEVRDLWSGQIQLASCHQTIAMLD